MQTNRSFTSYSVHSMQTHRCFTCWGGGGGGVRSTFKFRSQLFPPHGELQCYWGANLLYRLVQFEKLGWDSHWYSFYAPRQHEMGFEQELIGRTPVCSHSFSGSNPGISPYIKKVIKKNLGRRAGPSYTSTLLVTKQ